MGCSPSLQTRSTRGAGLMAGLAEERSTSWARRRSAALCPGVAGGCDIVSLLGSPGRPTVPVGVIRGAVVRRVTAGPGDGADLVGRHPAAGRVPVRARRLSDWHPPTLRAARPVATPRPAGPPGGRAALS